MQAALISYALFCATLCLAGTSNGIEQDSFAKFVSQPQGHAEPGLNTDPFHAFKYDLQSSVIDYFSGACDPTCCGETDPDRSASLPCCESCTELVDLRGYNIPFAVGVNATKRLSIDHGPEDSLPTPTLGGSCNCHGTILPTPCSCKAVKSRLESFEPGWDFQPSNGTRGLTGSQDQVPLNSPPESTVRTSTTQLVDAQGHAVGSVQTCRCGQEMTTCCPCGSCEDASLPQSVQPMLPDEIVEAKAFKLKIQDVDGGAHDLPACLCGKSRYITTACPCKEEFPDKTEL